MTLYRIGANSPLIDLLIEAAEAGKQVAVLVELKARFDERNNIIWANRLEEAGIHVVYGLVNLKTHCKLCLVVRQEADGIRRYAHIGTGNYNARDVEGLHRRRVVHRRSAAVLDDVSEVFNYLTGYSNRKQYRELLVAPVELRTGMRALIEREIAHAQAGRPARADLQDQRGDGPGDDSRRCIARRRPACRSTSSSRGVCCLRPGVPGVSDDDHACDRSSAASSSTRASTTSRTAASPRSYIGSADLMERNLDRRVEVLCPVRDPDIRHHLRHVVLDALLRETDRATRLLPDGEYVRCAPAPGDAPVSSQALLLEHYAQDEL